MKIRPTGQTKPTKKQKAHGGVGEISTLFKRKHTASPGITVDKIYP